MKTNQRKEDINITLHRLKINKNISLILWCQVLWSSQSHNCILCSYTRLKSQDFVASGPLATKLKPVISYLRW